MDKSNIWRNRFPIFQHHPNWVYLDSAATSQTLDSVIERMYGFSVRENSSIHRGIYDQAKKATERYEETRVKIAKFLNAKSHKNIGFTKGTTESINIIARSYLEPEMTQENNVIVSILEHHSNFLPWQEVCRRKGAELRILPLTNGQLLPGSLENLMDENTSFVALNHISNTLGRINPIKELIMKCREHRIPVMVDAAQSAALHPLHVEELGCDFLAFSGHKMFGPMGTGVLYARDEYRERIEPWMVGGGIIEDVGLNASRYRSFPYNLDAGTPNVQGILAMVEAVEFLESLDRKAARKYVAGMVSRFAEGVKGWDELEILPFYDEESGIVSFHIGHIHAHDIAGYLNRDGIAIRAGTHCTQPLLEEFGLEATARVSFSIYNTYDEVDKLIDSLRNLIEFWK
ncbi:MAG TPA: cysteine desulfurase [Saprospiraceae bacterium]|nr:cysteine desulfurase [Saprospiraceae bacterium]